MNAEPILLYHKVVIEVDGVPVHAWDLDTVSKLLAPQCWIERLDEATSSKADMSTYKVTAWTLNLAFIPTAKRLLIAEAELPIVYSNPTNQCIFGNLTPYLREKRVLDYPVELHLRRIFDFTP